MDLCVVNARGFASRADHEDGKITSNPFGEDGTPAILLSADTIRSSNRASLCCGLPCGGRPSRAAARSLSAHRIDPADGALFRPQDQAGSCAGETRCLIRIRLLLAVSIPGRMVMQIIKNLNRKFLFVPSTIFVLFAALIPALAESVTDRSTPPITPGPSQLLNNYWDTYVKGQYWRSILRGVFRAIQPSMLIDEEQTGQSFDETFSTPTNDNHCGPRRCQWRNVGMGVVCMTTICAG